MVHLHNLQRRYIFSEQELQSFVQKLLRAFHKKKGISLVFMNDRRIHEYNRQFLNHDYPTDVISFPLEDEQDDLLGEIFISTETAAREAEERNILLEEEVIRYVVHGCLHLFGYEDKESSAQKEMFRVQEKWVKKFFHERRV